MKLIIDIAEFTDILSVDFAPQTDISGTSVPIETMTVDIKVADADTALASIYYHNDVELYDDLDRLWCSYFVDNAVKISDDVIRVNARSRIGDLEHINLYGMMCSQKPIQEVLAQCLGTHYELDSSLANETITGYFPDQTARDRLLWACFAIGAYVNTMYTVDPQIKPISSAETLIPLQKTYMRPSESVGEIVTAVKVTAFTFAQAASQADWQNDNSSYRFPLPWVATEQELTLTNDEAPINAPENIVDIGEMYIINSSNASAILSRLALYYFKGRTVTLDCINNREYATGDKVTAYFDPQTMVTGYIESAVFKFGKQARSTLRIGAVETVASAVLTVTYICDGRTIATADYRFPVGYSYTLQNPYFDVMHNGHRYVYRPLTTVVTGTMASGTNTATVECEVALDLYRDALSIHAVDEIEETTIGSDSVGVIS